VVECGRPAELLLVGQRRREDLDRDEPVAGRLLLGEVDDAQRGLRQCPDEPEPWQGGELVVADGGS
jgi:hypothetical protein